MNGEYWHISRMLLHSLRSVSVSRDDQGGIFYSDDDRDWIKFDSRQDAQQYMESNLDAWRVRNPKGYQFMLDGLERATTGTRHVHSVSIRTNSEAAE